MRDCMISNRIMSCGNIFMLVIGWVDARPNQAVCVKGFLVLSFVAV